MRTIGEATHDKLDLDGAAAIWIHRSHGPQTKKERKTIFMKGGNEILTPVEGIVMFDIGKSGPYDHHKGGIPAEETSASLVAKDLGVDGDKNIQTLLGLVRRSDKQGISVPFDLSDITKCIQRNNDLSNEEMLEIDLRLIDDVMQFREKNLQRDHSFAQEIILEFLKREKAEKIPDKFRKYLEKLANKKFQRLFDFVEIVVAEKERVGKEEAVKFGMRILKLILIDTQLAFDRGMRDAKKATPILIGETLISYGYSEEPKYNTAVRVLWKATVIIQRRRDGHIHIFFDTKRITDELTDAIISVIRLEECLIQGRRVPRMDFRRPETIEEIPEWHYSKFPRIGKVKPGRFIFNGSRTASDVPVTKIPFDTLLHIVSCAVRYQPLNWPRWASERIAHYESHKNKN